jgi:hypothetical protein
MDIFSNKKNAKKCKEYFCKICDFNTFNKNNYDIHIHTIKHIRNNLQHSATEKTAKIYQCICGKIYNDRTGLWRHKKQCLKINKPEEKKQECSDVNEDKVNQLTEIIKTLITDNSELKSLIMVQQNTVTELVKNGINNVSNSHNTNINNSNNKAFNLNFFLNETCKDAMNMSEFINSLQIEYNDFEKLGDIGFVNGISNIIIKNLKDLDITQRPLHCTDKKREVMYVKEDNKWEKEDENYTRTRKLIKKTADKNMRLLPEFRKKYPDCVKSSSKYSDKYDLLIIETMGGSGDNDLEKETKILKNIAKEVFVDKSL